MYPYSHSFYTCFTYVIDTAEQSMCELCVKCVYPHSHSFYTCFTPWLHREKEPSSSLCKLCIQTPFTHVLHIEFIKQSSPWMSVRCECDPVAILTTIPWMSVRCEIDLVAILTSFPWMSGKWEINPVAILTSFPWMSGDALSLVGARENIERTLREGWKKVERRLREVVRRLREGWDKGERRLREGRYFT